MKSLLHNLLLLFLLYFLCRVVYLCEFWDLYGAEWQQLNHWRLFWGGLRFDTAAICYTNLPYILMCLLPLSPRVRDNRPWRLVAKTLFVVVNALALWLNLVDTVYSRYTGRRTTSSFFAEFADEGNLGHIFFTELVNHWYLLLIGVAFLAALLFLYRDLKPDRRPPKRRRLLGTTATLLALLLVFVGIRGGLTYHRPLSLSDANGYVNHPKEANIVLNTPFTLIRTIGKTTFADPQYFTEEKLNSLYTPIHNEGINAPANNLNSQ
ncbi:MAG: LTA synthase family protein, partial [Bacteroidales bacterium]|nr:LTA synthase family protein [Bacteroidales bacterium]